MPRFNIVKKTPAPKTFRSSRVQGLFDIPAANEREFRISGEIDIESKPWQIGAITGASGTGKSSIAEELFKKELIKEYKWTSDSFLDDFKKDLSTDAIIEALTSVGFNSTPQWLIPFNNLSNGQKFRATMARALAENDFVVVDEFTSVVDRIVAKAVSTSIKKYITRTKKRLVVVSCHSDILEWLQPDWTYNTDSARFSRDSLCRPKIQIKIVTGSTGDWKYFSGHHYMISTISKSARVFLVYAHIDGYFNLVGFFSVIPAMGFKGWWRGHRNVILPDFQGLGIGNRASEAIAEYLWTKEKKRFRERTSAPGLVKHRLKHPTMWTCIAAPEMKGPSASGRGVVTSAGRLTTSWIYVPEELRERGK